MKLPILTYHAIDDRDSVISTSPERFRSQVETIASMGMEAMSLERAYRHLDRHGTFPENAVVLTFDDGYRDLARHALPILSAHGFTATVFLVAELVGLDADEARARNADFSRDLLTWEQVGEMIRAGFEMGSHTLTHPDLTALPPDEREREIGDSRRILERRLGVPVTSLAYPYGPFNEAVREAAARHYRFACTTRLAYCAPGADAYTLPRIDMYYLQREERFAQALEGGLANWLRYRQALRDFKRMVHR